MTQLGQQELMEPGPRRRIIAPAGRSAWWGVDPSTRRVAVAGVSWAADGSLERWVREMPFMPLDGPQRLVYIRQATVELAGRMMDWPALRPGLVMVEQPGGTHRNYELFYATGVIVEAIASVVACPVEMVTPAWWKKRACGRGNIYKPKRKGEEYEVLTWARANGYTGLSWDEADAWGIAEAARREVALEER